MATALLAAFAAGFVARLVGLPALIGYLAAGFGLHAGGFEPDATLDTIADLGVLLLLFGIGLKLRVRTLVRPHVLVPTITFGLLGTGIVATTVMALGAMGMEPASDLDWPGALLIGLALSFASTVFAVQSLETTNETGSLAGRSAIAILVLQDLVAVGYLLVAEGELPSPWAAALVVGFALARQPLHWMMDRLGHGDLLVLFGFGMAVGVGAASFDAVGLKPDLGALVAGALVAGHPRAAELSDRLLGFKDLLLIGFFLSIGLQGSPPLEAWLIGFAAVALMPIRSGILLFLLTRFRLRVRTAFHTSVTLSTFSEFGLIVAAAAVAAGTMEPVWVSTIAIAIAVSFAVGAVLDNSRYRLYRTVGPRLHWLERTPSLPDDAVIDITDCPVLVFGMGRIGTGAYDEFARRGRTVLGIDRSELVVTELVASGRNVIRGDALDRDFWERVKFHPEVELVVTATNSHGANIECATRVNEFLPQARIASIAAYPDEIADLRSAGVDIARNLYEEAGQALAADASDALEEGNAP
jgi:predicted Kef-type K+ transport protein